MIDIKGLNKAEVLKALYDGSNVLGMGMLQAVPYGYITVERCQMLLDNTGYPYFDYLYGRVIKVDLSGDEFDERLYDRDNGLGAAQRAIDRLRNEIKKKRGTLHIDPVELGIAISINPLDFSIHIRFDGIESVDALIDACENLKREIEESV